VRRSEIIKRKCYKAKIVGIKIRLFEVNVLLCLLSSALPTTAQIIPDATLSNNSSVTSEDNTSTITGGTTAGGNLFHSFQQFSIPSGNGAYFNNTLDIQNIISRVTGSLVSNIDGLIRANGTANLFLLNPNGIIFGPNAQLNIGGSFLGSTANSINFADGTHFSAKNTQTTTLLTVNVPIGLGFGSNPGGIRVQGSGHNLVGQNFRPVIGAGSSAGLRARPGNSLALVGGDVTLEGGILTAPGGRIEVGSVDSGVVSLNSTNSGWTLDYTQVPAFKDVHLSTRTLVDTSGFGAGSIQLQGRRVSLTDGSVVLIQNQGLLPSGELRVNASGSLEVSGTDPIAKIPGSIRTETVAPGKGGDIVISTPRLALTTGGAITAITYSGANAGNISLKVPETVQVIGASPRSSMTVSSINSVAFSSGQAGDISVQTGKFTARDGALLLSTTTETGAGGDVRIDATESVELSGMEPNTFTASSIGASTSGGGNAGNVTINTSRLLLRDGGRVDSSTVASGAAGSITLNASDSVEVKGTVSGSRNPSLIISSANILDEAFRRSFGLPDLSVLTGESGNVEINTGRLSISDKGQISVKNDGSGNAGTLRIYADSIFLDNFGGITAATTSGEGGDITLQTENLQLRQGSTITTAAGGSGNGGNINIDTGILAALENSSIIANAFEGRGGNITINAQGLFLSPNSKIDASSSLGIDGTVQINTPYLELSKAAASTPSEPENPKVASVCQGGSGKVGSSLVNAGTGGIPASPSDPLSSISGWHDNSISTQESSNSQEIAPSTEAKPVQELVEAQGWKWNPDGTLSTTLEPEPGGVVPYGSLTTPPCQQATQAPRASHSK